MGDRKAKVVAQKKKKFESECDTSEAEGQNTIAGPLQAKLGSFRTRVLWSFIMIGGFLAVLVAGHLYCCVLVLLLNCVIFKEIISLKRNALRDQKIPLFYLLNWYFFFITEVFSILTFLKQKILLLPYEFIEVTHI